MAKYRIGDIVEGKVTGIESYGIFVLIDDNIAGLIHISELSDLFVRDVKEYANIDEIIRVKIIEYDEEHGKMKLSIKGIDYRNEQNKKHGIIETKKGFSSLSNELDTWIVKKEEELQ